MSHGLYCPVCGCDFPCGIPEHEARGPVDLEPDNDYSPQDPT